MALSAYSNALRRIAASIWRAGPLREISMVSMSEGDRRNNVRKIRCPFCGQPSGHLADRKERASGVDDKPTPVPADVAPMTNYYECAECESKFTTREVYSVSNRDWRVKRRGEQGALEDANASEPFDLLKVRGSLQKATRKIDEKTIWKVAHQVVQYLNNKDEFPPKLNTGRMAVFASETIGEAVMIALLNSHLYSAWIRYALVFYDRERVENFGVLLDFLQEKYNDHQAVLYRIKKKRIRIPPLAIPSSSHA